MKELKVCTKCGELKPFEGFGKNKLGKYLLRSHCKSCALKKISDYKKTKRGLITRIYSGQRQTSRYRGYIYPNYTLKELRKLAFNLPEFHLLYNNWVKSGYQKDWTPSFDRDDDYKPYTLDSIQLVPWWMNYERYYTDRKNGVNTKTRKPVVATHKITGKQTIYKSIKIAALETNSSKDCISGCCLNKKYYKSAGGYYWKFKN